MRCTSSGPKRPARPRIGRVITPAWTAGPPSSESRMCAFSSAISSSPGSERVRRAISFAIVAVGTKTDSSWPSKSATRRSSSLTVGSSRRCSSPTSAFAIASRMPRLGCVFVSERRSITPVFCRGMDITALHETLERHGEPGFRAHQVWAWVARGATGYDEMTDVPAALRARLAERLPISTLEVEHEARSRDGTVKTLFRTGDGLPVEAVLMRFRDGRRSVCLSSQSGCPLTCTFCATGQMRFRRNLTASELLDQALHFRRLEAIDHVVFMGMGEQMLNFDEVIAAARRQTDLGVPHRTKTGSAVGWLSVI